MQLSDNIGLKNENAQNAQNLIDLCVEPKSPSWFESFWIVLIGEAKIMIKNFIFKKSIRNIPTLIIILLIHLNC